MQHRRTAAFLVEHAARRRRAVPACGWHSASGPAALGDPACDLVIAWTFMGQERDTFRAAVQVDADNSAHQHPHWATRRQQRHPRCHPRGHDQTLGRARLRELVDPRDRHRGRCRPRAIRHFLTDKETLFATVIADRTSIFEQLAALVHRRVARPRVRLPRYEARLPTRARTTWAERQCPDG